MPDQYTDAEEKLRKLGERLRQGAARERAIQERSQDTVRSAVREEWQREQARKPKPTPPGKQADREPSEPDHER